MSDPGLNYKVTVSGASQGASEIDKVAQATAKVATETGKAAPAAKSFGEAVSSLGGRNNPAKDVLEGISTAARGGEGSIFGLTKAFKGLRELMTGGFAMLGPGGILVAGIGVLVGLLPKLWDLMSTGKKSAEELAKELALVKSETDALGKARIENLNIDLKHIEESAGTALERFKQLAAAAQKIDDAQRTLDLAKVDADPSLSAEERVRRTQQINATFDQRKTARGVSVDAKEAALAEDAAQKAQLEETAAANERTAADNKLKSILPGIDAKINELKDALDRELQTPSLDEYASLAAVSNFNRKAAPLEARKQAIASGQDPETERLRIELADADKRLAIANNKALGLGQRAGDLRDRQALEAQTRDIVEPLENKTRGIKNQKAIQQAKQADGTTREQIKARLAGHEGEAAAFDKQAQEAQAKNDNIGQQEAADGFKKATAAVEKDKADLKQVADASTQFATAYTAANAAQSATITTGVSAIKEATAKALPAPSLDPLVSEVKAMHSDFVAKLSVMQSAINQNAREIANLRAQASNSR